MVGGTAIPNAQVVFTPSLIAGTQYSPGLTYTITVTGTSTPQYPSYGMNLEIINSTATSPSSVGMFGTFGVPVTSNCQIYSYATTNPYPTCVSHNQASASPFMFTWVAPSSGTGYLYCDVLGVNLNGNVSGDRVSGVYSLTLTPYAASGIQQQEVSINAINVYPNPAKENITINYTLGESGNIDVKLYTIDGTMLVHLLNATVNAGTQSHQLHIPPGTSKGVYFLKIEINGAQKTQKLMLL